MNPMKSNEDLVMMVLRREPAEALSSVRVAGRCALTVEAAEAALVALAARGAVCRLRWTDGSVSWCLP